MNKILFFCIFSLCSVTLFGQEKPLWFDVNTRNSQFPNSIYLTGFADGNDLEKVRTAAQIALLENLRVIIKSKTTSELTSISHNENYDEFSLFQSSAEKSVNAEIAGMKTETYVDQKSKLVYAFAYANRYELIGYYKSNLSVNLSQIESFVKTAQDLEANHEKVKARQQLEIAKPLFSKVRYAQDLLTALDGNATPNDLQQPKTEQLYNVVTQLLAKLAQGVYVFVESNENLFGQKVDIVANKVKAELAVNGCSFTDTDKADFILRITVTTRSSDTMEGIAFCYADAAVELYDVHKQKTIYSDEIAQKGGSNSKDKAGRKAMDDVATKISEKLKNWIQ